MRTASGAGRIFNLTHRYTAIVIKTEQMDDAGHGILNVSAPAKALRTGAPARRMDAFVAAHNRLLVAICEFRMPVETCTHAGSGFRDANVRQSVLICVRNNLGDKWSGTGESAADSRPAVSLVSASFSREEKTHGIGHDRIRQDGIQHGAAPSAGRSPVRCLRRPSGSGASARQRRRGRPNVD
jgi:hypothetical protein